MTTLFAAIDTIVDLNLYHLANVADNGSDVSKAYLTGSQAMVSFKSSDTGNVREDLAFSMRNRGIWYVDHIGENGSEPIYGCAFTISGGRRKNPCRVGRRYAVQ